MSKQLCPLCEEPMDFIVISHKNHAFVDGKCYPKMCFTCYQVPKTYKYEFDSKGSILTTEGPIYSHNSLHTAEELYENRSADSLQQAKKSVTSVKRACEKVSLRVLNKLKIKKPAPVYELVSSKNSK